MVDIAHDPETGQHFARGQGGEWRPVDAQDLDALESSAGEAFLQNMATSAAGTLRGAAALGSPQTRRMQLDIMQEEARQRDLRTEAAPIAGTAGTVAGYIPDVAAGVVTGGGGFAASAGRVAATEAALGALRNPEDPLTGAAVQGALGLGGAAVGPAAGAMYRGSVNAGRRARAIIQRVPAGGRVASVADDVADGSLSAARTSTSSGATPFLTPSQADNMGLPLTNAETRMLGALDSGNNEAIAAARQGLANSDMIQNSQFGPGFSVGDLGAAAGVGQWGNKSKQEWFTKFVARQLDRPDLDRLFKTSMKEIRDETSDTYKRIFDKNTGARIHNIFMDADGQNVFVAEQARGIMEATQGEASTSVQNAVKGIERALARGQDGVFHTDELLEVRRGITKDAERAFQAGEHATGEKLTTIGQIVDDAMERALPEADQAALARAGFKWKIKKVLERTKGAISNEDPGVINPVAFQNNYRQMTPGYRRHFKDLDDFERTMDTIAMLSENRANAGNTLFRAVGPAASAGGALLGMGAIF